jgi:hypothetical protein
MGELGEPNMTPSLEEELRSRIAELEKENARLVQVLEWTKEERKELRDIVFANAPPSRETSEEEYLEMMRNHVPGSGRKFMEELGIIPGATV